MGGVGGAAAVAWEISNILPNALEYYVTVFTSLDRIPRTRGKYLPRVPMTWSPGEDMRAFRLFVRSVGQVRGGFDPCRHACVHRPAPLELAAEVEIL